MTLFLAWSTQDFPDEVVGASPGPWREVRRVEQRVLLVDSDATLSQVYHHLKWSFDDAVATLLVTRCDDVKAKGLPSGTLSWARPRLSRDPPSP